MPLIEVNQKYHYGPFRIGVLIWIFTIFSVSIAAVFSENKDIGA